MVVLEREIAGFGASGRNGGWCHTTFPGSRERAEKTHGRQAVVDQQRALFDTVPEIARVVADEGIDARLRQGGQMDLATSAVQLLRAKAAIDYERSWGFGEEDYRLLSLDETRERVRVAGCLGAVYTPHGAAVDPARLARGLAEAVERLGVPIYERTPVTEIGEREAQTPFGRVKADVVVRATEAFTPELPGHERLVVPIYSLMIATEPLPQEFWRETGWDGHEVFGDFRHLIFYAMHTDDGRIAIGGRGAPYHFNSRLSEKYERVPAVQDHLRELLGRALPPHRCRADHSPAGAAPSPQLETGTARSAWTGAPARPGPAHTWVMASPPPISPAAPCATSSWATIRRSPDCRGSATARSSGSPNRCAGSE